MNHLKIALIVAGILAATLNDLGLSDVLGAQQPPSEIERLQIENLALKQQLITVMFRAETCEGKLAPTNLATDAKVLQAEFAALKERLEAARPGYTWDGKTFTKKAAP